MRWNHLILALLGVCILSKGVHSVDNPYISGYDDDGDDDNKVVTQPNDQNGEETTPEYPGPDDYGSSRQEPEDGTVDVNIPVETTEEPVDGNPEDNGGETPGPVVINIGQPEDTNQEPTDVPDPTPAPIVEPEETTPEDNGEQETTEDPEDLETTPEPEVPETPETVEETTPDDSEDHETTPEPEVPETPETVEETTPEDSNPETTEVPDQTVAPVNQPEETTPEDYPEETTEYVEETTEDSSGAETPEPVEETTEDPGTGGQGFESTTEADVEPTTEDLSYLKKMANARLVPQGPWGNGKQYPTMDPADKATLKDETALGDKPKVLPDGRSLDDLTDEYVVIDGEDDWSKVVANKNGFFVLHPVQTSGNDVIFDPYTIGQVLGYIYEFQEFGGQEPTGGWTIDLMGKSIPNAVRRKRSEGVKSRRATLVFTKKADVVAKEEHDYWKKVIASI